MVGDMIAIETAVEWLRPFVKNKAWDYCIIWKLGDDPSRFIEWGACCCSGGNRLQIIENINGESSVENNLIAECKDTGIKHLVRSKACKALAELPSFIPLYSGIHGDVVISKQPKWVVYGESSASDTELTGTQVLIPLANGLIELFCAKHVPKNPMLVDYVFARFKISLKQENMSEKACVDFNLREQLSDSYSNNYIENWPPSLYESLSFVPPLSQRRLEGSSIDSCLASKLQSHNIDFGHMFGTMKPKKISKRHADSPSRILRMKWKRNADIALTYAFDNKRVKTGQKAEKGPYTSKNLVTERNRRKRIKDGIFALRALVPNISKMDRLATLGDAADYIQELEETIENYREQLRAIEVDDCRKNCAKQDEENLPVFNHIKSQSRAGEKKPTEVQVEVSQIGKRDFLLKLVCKQKRGSFSMLMKAVDSLGLQVTDANVTTYNGSVLNILKLEANQTEIELKTLKNSLFQLVNYTINEEVDKHDEIKKEKGRKYLTERLKS